jgi:hypothetical protein
MIQYNTTDKEIVVPQGLGNLPITINQSGGDVTKLSYVIDITNREGNILNREEALNIYNNFDKYKIIIRFEQEDIIYSMEIFNVIYDITGVRVEGILSDSIFAWEFADETITEVEPQITPLSAWVENYEMVYALATLNNKQTIENRDNITLLNERITDIENNDDFIVISPVELGINENNVFKSPYTIGEWRNILNSNKTIILRMPIQANSMDNVEDSEVNYCERYIIGSDNFTGIQIIFKWYTLYFPLNTNEDFIPNIKLYKTEPLRYDALIDDLDERVTTLDENVTSLDNRVTTLENNSGSSNDNTLIIELSATDGYSLNRNIAEQIINNFETKKIIIKFEYTDNDNNRIFTEIEVISVEYNNGLYKRIVGIFNGTTYIWEYSIDNLDYEVKPKIAGVIKYEINGSDENYSIYESDLKSLIQTKKNNPNSQIVLYHRGYDSFITDIVTMDYFLNYENEQNFYVYAIVGSEMLRWYYYKGSNPSLIPAEIKNLWE